MSEPVGDDIVTLYQECAEAAAAVAAWTKRLKEKKAALLAATGYSPDDPRPPSRVVLGPGGAPLFEVVVTYRRDVDRDYIRTRYPAVWAEAERDVPVRSVKAPQS